MYSHLFVDLPCSARNDVCLSIISFSRLPLTDESPKTLPDGIHSFQPHVNTSPTSELQKAKFDSATRTRGIGRNILRLQQYKLFTAITCITNSVILSERGIIPVTATQWAQPAAAFIIKASFGRGKGSGISYARN